MLTCKRVLQSAHEAFGSREAIAGSDRAVTYAELWEYFLRVPACLRARGAKPGDRVALLAGNSVEVSILHHVVPSSGFIFVPINTRLAPVEVEAIIQDCQPSVVIVDRPLTGIRHSEGPQTINVVELSILFDELALAEPSESPDPLETEISSIFYTGGTTGRPKGVMLSHRNRVQDALELIALTGLEEFDSWLYMSPMFHAGGAFAVFACTWAGARQTILPFFDPLAALTEIERGRATVTFGVPTMLNDLARRQAIGDTDTSNMRLIGYGAAPMTTAVLTDVRRAFPMTELVSMYGCTEMTGVITASRHHERTIGSTRSRSCGRASYGIALQVCDVDGRPQPIGQVGEIRVRSPKVMSGYWHKPLETAAAKPAEDAYRTGDLGYLDDEHFLYIVDRVDDQIVSGGENVYTTEVEEVLIRHDRVIEVAVVGIPDERWGKRVGALIYSEDGVTSSEIEEFCRKYLAGYKVPKTVLIQAAPLPRTAAGKISKVVALDVLKGIGEEASGAPRERDHVR